MFCSSCGRTLLPGDTQCACCGAPVAETVFTGYPYTSVQKRLTPGDTPYSGERVYVKASYYEAHEPVAEPEEAPVEDAQAAEAPLEPETMEEAPEEEAEVRPEVRTGGETADEELLEGEKEISSLADDMDDLRARPIVSQGQSGISSDVTEYMEKLEARSRRARHKKAKRGEPVEGQAPEAEAAVQPEEPVEEYEPEDEEIDERSRLSPKALQAIKIAALLVVLALLVWGIFAWVRHVRESTKGSPIDGVAPELYDSGIAMITSHADTSYVKGLLATDGILPLTQKLQEDENAIAALTPAEASIGDGQFVHALQSIQSNINNTVTMDYLAIAQPTADSTAASEARWRVINDSIAQLKAATTTNELEAIINGERIAIQTIAPTPTPVPERYNTLTRGDKSEEVRQMQERLWELGFLQDVRDGNFGGNTYTAVKAFQQAAGLDVTGIADSKTLSALYADDAPRTAQAQSTAGGAATTGTAVQTEDTADTGAVADVEDAGEADAADGF